MPLLNTMLVLDLRSCVEEVTDAITSLWLSVSMMMRFLLSCSWIRITCAWPSVQVINYQTRITGRNELSAA